MKKNFNFKPSQEYTNVSIYNTILLKIKNSKIIYIISIFVIKYSSSYKHISRGHISHQYGHSRCHNTDTLKPISARRMNYSDIHKNRVRYNINTTNKDNSKIWII